jgi:RNA polymerase sigma factor (sigma-70 family)
MDCNEINSSQKLITFFREENDIHLNKVFKCFFNLFFEDFRRLTYKYCLNKFHTKHKEDELAKDAFNDGLMSFYFKLRNEGFEEKGAQVKTAFFSFCIFKLRGLTKTLGRRSVKETVIDPAIIFNNLDLLNTSEVKDVWDYEHLLNTKEEIFSSALKELGERGSNLIIWKKVLKLKNEEIADRMGIKPDTVPNEVYKSFNKLKEIVDKLKGAIK